MAFVARASTTVRNKNLLIILMCAVFFVWFAYDGFVGYPRNNDRLVNRLVGLAKDGKIATEHLSLLETWQGWSNETPENRAKLDAIVAGSKNQVEGWKATLDISVQRWIVQELGVATAAAAWWFIHCQRRRAIAEETTVSPMPGVVIPWEKITRVDNTRWKSTGIVEITFPGPDGTPQKAKFDDYELERKPLLDILDLLLEKAVNAEFIPKEDAAPESAEGVSPEPSKP